MAQHSPPGSPAALEAPSPAQPRPHAQSHQPARDWAESVKLPSEDPAAMFSFAPGPGANARGAGGSTADGTRPKVGNVGARGGRSAFVPPQAVSSSSAPSHPTAGRRGEQPPLAEEGDGVVEDDAPDEVVFVQPKRVAKDPVSPSPRGTAYDELAPYRLRAPVDGPAPPRGTKSSVPETFAAPDLGLNKGTCAAGQGGGAPYSTATTKALHPPSVPAFGPGRSQSRLPAVVAAKPAERERASAAAPMSGAPSKKRARAGETSPPTAATGEAASQSQSQSQSQAHGGHGTRVSSLKSTVDGGNRSASAKTVDEDVRDGKRRKSGPASKSQDIVQHVMQLDEELKTKEATIARIRDRLERRDAELLSVTEDKRKLKEEMLDRVRAALDNANAVHQELSEAKASMEDSLRRVKQEMGAVVTAAEVRAQLAELQEEFSAYVLDENNEIWLERFEDRKLEVLKALQAELVKRQDVIDLLRADLETNAGALAESRAQAQDLEARVDAAQGKIDALRRELDGVDALRGEKAAIMSELDRVLVEAAEREEAHRTRRVEAERVWEERLAKRDGAVRGAEEKLSEGAEREETLRGEWIKAKEEAAGQAAELALTKERITDLERKRDDDARAIQLLSADLTKARAELSAEIELSKSRLASVRSEFDTEKSALVQRIEEVKAAAADELAEAKAKLAQTVADHKEALAGTADEAKAVEAKHQAQLAEARQREATVSRSLEETRTALRGLESQNTAKLDAALSTGSTVDGDELQSLRSQVAQLTRETETLTAAKRQTEESRRGIAESHNRLKLDGEAQTALVAQLQRELTAAQAQNAQLTSEVEAHREREQQASEERDAREKGMTEQAAKERQQAAAAALQQGKEFGQRELLQKGNELKRANNKLEELTKKHNRVLNELAKAKARPILDPHIASSSTNGDPSPQQASRTPALVKGQANGTTHARISAIAPSSDLTTLDSDESPVSARSGDATAVLGGGRPKPKPKSVKFDVSTDPPAAPSKPRRRASSTAAGGAPARPAKKVVPAAAGSSSKARRTPRVYDTQDADDGDADRTLVDDPGMTWGLEYSLEEGTGGAGEEGEETESEDEDEIVDSNTPLPPAPSKPKTRTTYASSSSKKRR